MNRSVGLTLRRTAGGGVIFALGFGALAAPGRGPTAVVASTGPTVIASSAQAQSLAASPDPDRHPLPRVRPSVAQFQDAAAIAIVPSKPATLRSNRALRATPTVVKAAPVVRPAAGGSSAAFAYGYCTWWVAHKRSIPWRGNAAEWWWNARAYGFPEGQTPQVGAVMVMAAGGAAAPEGHVAYVESVNGDGSFVVSEMNWWGVPGGGWGRVDYRTVRSMRGILGFIY